MDYTHVSAGGVTTCDMDVDDWDVCTNRTTMTFNYTTCGTTLATSSKLYHIYYIPLG